MSDQRFDTRADLGRPQASRNAAGSAPLLVADPAAAGTGLILFPRADSLPGVWVGPVPADGLDPGDAAALLTAARPCSLLPQHAEGGFGRPGLSGHRLGTRAGGPAGHPPGTRAGGPAAGRDWSPLVRPGRVRHRG